MRGSRGLGREAILVFVLPPSLEVLEENLDEFPGALVLVTHDRYMIDRMCTQLVGLDGFGGVGLYADLSQWETAVDCARSSAREAEKREKPPAPAAPASTARPTKRRLTWNEQREWDTMESRILEAEQTIEICKKDMESPAVLADHRRLADLCARMDEAQTRVHDLYVRWAELEAKLEAPQTPCRGDRRLG